MENVSNGGSVLVDPAFGEEAFNALLPEFQALSTDDLLQIGVDVNSAVITVLGVVPQVRALVKQLTRVPPELEPALLDKMEQCTFALGWVQAGYASATAGASELAALVEEAEGLRETLVADMNALARRGFIDEGRLTRVQTSTGYKQLSSDLLILVRVLKDNWDAIQGKCAIDAKEVDRAHRVAERINKLLGAKEQAPTVSPEATEMRQRVFTVFAKRYDDIRMGVTYARWKKQDADDIAPSLYAGRARRRSGSDVPEQPVTPVTPPPAAPGASGSAPVKPSTGSALSAAAETDPFMS